MKKTIGTLLILALMLLTMVIPREVQAASGNMNFFERKYTDNGYAETWYYVTSSGRSELYVRAGHTGDNNYVVGSQIKRNSQPYINATASYKGTVQKGPYSVASRSGLQPAWYDVMAY